MSEAERIEALERQVESLKEAVVKLALADYKSIYAVTHRRNMAECEPALKEMFALHDEVAALVGGKNLARE